MHFPSAPWGSLEFPTHASFLCVPRSWWAALAPYSRLRSPAEGRCACAESTVHRCHLLGRALRTSLTPALPGLAALWGRGEVQGACCLRNAVIEWLEHSRLEHVGSAIHPTVPGFSKPGLDLTQEAPANTDPWVHTGGWSPELGDEAASGTCAASCTPRRPSGRGHAPARRSWFSLPPPVQHSVLESS
uniref:Uncharacterized protein n=1 Tax=Molossus molossus TaxID=27622 RepID=A0A7J8CZG7_MOLMO|nr:hypothetical protein HJG59_009532 [Molossus molossus]